MSEQTNKSRRGFLKKSAYAVPVVLTLKAAPAVAGYGSPKKDHSKDKNKHSSKDNNKNNNKNNSKNDKNNKNNKFKVSSKSKSDSKRKS